MPDLTFSGASAFSIQQAIDALSQIGAIGAVELRPSPFQLVIIRGTAGKITFNSETASLYGGGAGGGEDLVSLMKALGWPHHQWSTFKSLEPTGHYLVVREAILEL